MNAPLTPSQIYNIKVAQMEAKKANHAHEPSLVEFMFLRMPLPFPSKSV